ncbi:CDP-glycerol glycerophosphotransferase family protein [Priestia aryabhattai]|uniref:CDP-glycerol glycerophosphotransferase family protein n=1 Tax=Priestia aryabhattai TaxID=412384 RepID=UPI00064E9935|nr:CDP-glycerol glycerophosphotransferase family protein [Priestia aryabhattai]KML28310.1 hypothetical protein VL11_16415 [Priestia aryabhattai]KMO01685.1 hypothetical protein ABV89_01430 [Priestia aryabhattai]
MKKNIIDLLKRRLLSVVLNVCLVPVYLISYCIPKRKDLIVFGGSRGKHIADNSSYLFEYIKLNSTNQIMKPIWLTKNKDLEDKTENIYYVYSLLGLKHLILAKSVVISHHLDDLIPWLLGGKTIFQVWHGVPLKKIGYLSDGWDDRSDFQNFLIKCIITFIPYLKYNKCNYVYTTSSSLTHIMSRSFDIDEENVIVTGQPRNDKLVTEIARIGLDGPKAILWMPTHRGRSNFNINNLMLDYGFDFIEAEKFLERTNTILYIKPHFTELDKLDELFQHQNSPRIKLINKADPLKILLNADMLITDYSSVYFDYLLLNRPIIFAPFDYDIYKETITGFNFKYKDMTPGPKCKSWNEIFEQVEEMIYDDKYEEDRKNVNEFINQYQDNKACERVMNHIIDNID